MRNREDLCWLTKKKCESLKKVKNSPRKVKNIKNLNIQKRSKKKNSWGNEKHLFQLVSPHHKAYCIKTTTQSRLWFSSSSTISQLVSEREKISPGSLVKIQQARTTSKTELMALVPTDDFYIGAVFMFCRMRARSITARKNIYSTFIDQHIFTFFLHNFSLSLSLTPAWFFHPHRKGWKCSSRLLWCAFLRLSF